MFDKIIVSSDESYFIEYLPIVCKAWEKFYNITVTLAFVSNRVEEDPFVQKLREYCDVVIFPIIEGIPVPNQAKMARHFLASLMGDEVCMIEDIDTIPLQTNFIDKIVSQRKTGKLLLVGQEVYEGSEHSGKIPISNMMGEGYLFQRIINPFQQQYEDLIKSWIDIKYCDHKEAINSAADKFSDESLIRALISINDVHGRNIQKINRDVNPKNDWIDRSWWSIDKNKLNSGGYVICNFLRPFFDNYLIIEPVVKYIYGENVKIEDAILIL